MGNLESVLWWWPTPKESLRGAHIRLEGHAPSRTREQPHEPEMWMNVDECIGVGIVQVIK